ncbi:SDR family oxidoreductase [Candidatus Bathyarchaeota archaeon]|nr:SDR family oxidoreductase [Candidatus Bathyarchaeota archaeon]
MTQSCISRRPRFSPYPIYWQPSRRIWQWFLINSDIFGCDWRRSEVDDDAYELVVVRKGEDPGLQGFFYTFLEATEFSTKDLYQKHPTLPDHWLYYGRADDILVFSNGEKLNPVIIETVVMGHPDVLGALVVGANRFQPALIIEPRKHPETQKEEKEFLDSVWPRVVKANQETVAHGQIRRNFIALSKPEKPFHRAGKGTVQRPGTVTLYADYIDEIYETAGQAAVSDAVKLDLSSPDALVGSIMEIFRASAVAAPLDPDTDFFQSGVDSMQVINTSRVLRASLESAGVQASADALATRVIYRNPTPWKLARYLFSVAKSGADGVQDSEHEVIAMQTQIERYTRDLPAMNKDKARPVEENQTVLLTGSTGALSSYLLDMMCASPRVRRIICLNRSENSRERQTNVSASRGLSTDFSKVEFLHADLGRDMLGLNDEADYARLQNEVDRVIHNQWPVNFNIAVVSFEPHVRGVRHLVDWTPIESVANTILEVSGVASRVPLEDVHGYFHGVNPSTTTWRALAQAVKEYYSDRIRELVPFTEWVRALEKTQAAAEDVSRNPAIKLLDTYRAFSAAEGHVDIETSRTQMYSKTMKEMGPVSPELMKNWCRQWAF